MSAVVLHLSIPVADLAAAKEFYERTLGCRPGRQRAGWVDVWFYGMQLTLQQRPDEVRPLEAQGVRHFGVALPPEEFDAVVARVAANGGTWLSGPVQHTAAELNGKRAGKLADPSGNVIEIKCYERAEDLAALLAAAD